MRPVGVQPVQDQSDIRPPAPCNATRKPQDRAGRGIGGGPGPQPRELWRTAAAQSRALCRLRTLTHLATGHGDQGSRRAKGDAESSSSLRGRPGRGALSRPGARSRSVPLWSRGIQGTGGTRDPEPPQPSGRGRRRSQLSGKLPGLCGRNAPGGGAAPSRGGAREGVVRRAWSERGPAPR